MTAPAAWAGVTRVIEVSVLAVRLVAALPPKVTPVARARSVPVMVTEVPPPRGPVVVVSEVMTGAAT